MRCRSDIASAAASRRGNGKMASRGFTLIELILVMAMLLVVMSVTFPSLKGFFRARTLDSESRRFLSLTRFAQSRAISEGVPMLLWVDAREKSYGLRAEASYIEQDEKALQFDLNPDLTMEASVSVARAPARMRSAGVGNLPTIRFLPDGSIGESSPDRVRFVEGDGDKLSVVMTENRLNYAIEATREKSR
jgi:type II secretion system protein H